MAARGNQSRFKAEPFSVKYTPGRGYAVIDDNGETVVGYVTDPARAQIACDAKIAAAARAAKAITRPCLRCGHPFQSLGIHNRMCGQCRHLRTADLDPVGYSFGAMTGRRK